MNINSVNNAYFRNSEIYQKTRVNKVNNKETELKENTDVVDFSTRSFEKSEFDNSVINYKVNYNRGVDNQRLNELKEQYKGDSCPVTSQQIAGSILNRVVGYCL